MRVCFSKFDKNKRRRGDTVRLLGGGLREWLLRGWQKRAFLVVDRAAAAAAAASRLPTSWLSPLPPVPRTVQFSQGWLSYENEPPSLVIDGWSSAIEIMTALLFADHRLVMKICCSERTGEQARLVEFPFPFLPFLPSIHLSFLLSALFPPPPPQLIA